MILGMLTGRAQGQIHSRPAVKIDRFTITVLFRL